MANYDEDLFDNPFFLAVHKQFTGLFNQSVAAKALLCVPKYSTCLRKTITQADVEDHILIPEDAEDEDNSLYKTLSGKVVSIADGKLKTSKGFEIQQAVKLLFEETFHSENDNSYRVLCIDHFLNRPPETSQASKGPSAKGRHPTSYEQCLDVLWNHAGGQKTRDNLDKQLNAFAEIYDSFEGENLRSLMDMASAHFTKAMQLLLRDSVVRKSVKHNPAYMDSLKIAVETYLMNAVHLRLFRVLTAVMASEDAEINKVTRNLAAVQLQDLGIRKIFSQNLPPAKKELAGLNRFSTPLGRLFCIKRVVTALTRPPKHADKDDSSSVMTTDDFLPILIFLIVKSEIPNWMANLVYMRHFHFAKSNDDDEFGFYLASVEAALEHIKSGNISEDMKMNKQKRDRAWTLLDFSPTHGQTEGTSEGTGYQRQMSVIDNFFKSVQEGNEQEVRRLLHQPQRSNEEVYLKLCHPLCSCDRCDKILASMRNNSDLVTAYTRDNRGYTALHMAAYYGQGKLIDLLVKNGAVVDATDYLGLTPLHLACQRGYQNVMLLLVHFGADVMARDNEGNTPLHHCCLNGHDDCVKGLVFYDASCKNLEINACNEFGDTALHMAAKWGYENIVKTLLENGGNAMLKNRKRQSPVHVAQNVKVQRLLQQSVEGLELQLVSTFQSSIYTVKKNPSRTGSVSSADAPKQNTLTETLTANSDIDDVSSSGRVETASLDEAQDRQMKKKKEKLFKAIVDGDIQLVKFYLGLEDDEMSSPQTDEEVLVAGKSLDDMCHPLCQCSRCLSIQKARVKANQNLSVNVKTTAGYTPLHMSVLHKHDDLTRLFLKHGAHVNAQNHKNLTPLHIAVCLKRIQVVHMLLERGARLNVRDINGDSPLLICSASGFTEGVQALIQKGADVNVTNYRGNTALHEAADHAHLGIIRLLLDAGADPTTRNKLTQTAANMARDAPTERLLQAAAADWQKKRAEQRHRSLSQRVVGKSQVKVQDLFAAFEEDDLRTLKSLTASVRSFHKEGTLRKTVTRNNTNTVLDSLTHAHFIESFDQSSLKHVKPCDKSKPLYIYSLTSGEKSTEDEYSDTASGASFSKSDLSGDSNSEEITSHSRPGMKDKSQSKDGGGMWRLQSHDTSMFDDEDDDVDLSQLDLSSQDEELFRSRGNSMTQSENESFWQNAGQSVSVTQTSDQPASRSKSNQYDAVVEQKASETPASSPHTYPEKEMVFLKSQNHEDNCDVDQSGEETSSRSQHGCLNVPAPDREQVHSGTYASKSEKSNTRTEKISTSSVMSTTQAEIISSVEKSEVQAESIAVPSEKSDLQAKRISSREKSTFQSDVFPASMENSDSQVESSTTTTEKSNIQADSITAATELSDIGAERMSAPEEKSKASGISTSIEKLDTPAESIPASVQKSNLQAESVSASLQKSETHAERISAFVGKSASGTGKLLRLSSEEFFGPESDEEEQCSEDTNLVTPDEALDTLPAVQS